MPETIKTTNEAVWAFHRAYAFLCETKTERGPDGQRVSLGVPNYDLGMKVSYALSRANELNRGALKPLTKLQKELVEKDMTAQKEINKLRGLKSEGYVEKIEALIEESNARSKEWESLMEEEVEFTPYKFKLSEVNKDCATIPPDVLGALSALSLIADEKE